MILLILPMQVRIPAGIEHERHRIFSRQLFR